MCEGLANVPSGVATVCIAAGSADPAGLPNLTVAEQNAITLVIGFMTIVKLNLVQGSAQSSSGRSRCQQTANTRLLKLCPGSTSNGTVAWLSRQRLCDSGSTAAMAEPLRCLIVFDPDRVFHWLRYLKRFNQNYASVRIDDSAQVQRNPANQGDFAAQLKKYEAVRARQSAAAISQTCSYRICPGHCH